MVHAKRGAMNGRGLVSMQLETLEGRQLLAAPVLDQIEDVSVPGGKSLFVPVTASDADGNRLTYTATSSNPLIKVLVNRNNTYLRFQVKSTGSAGNIEGNLEFQLFEDLAPETVKVIKGLVTSEFYNGLTFHRLADLTGKGGFILQGGNRSWPYFTYKYADEFAPSSIFSGRGQLALANATNTQDVTSFDGNGSQFFITGAPVRHLDFNHTIFGQMVRGFDVFDQLTGLRNLSGDTPTQTITIVKAEIVTNRTDGVLTVTAPAGQSGRITVKVSDGTGAVDTQTFFVRGVADSVNDPPYLKPVKDMFVPAGKPVTITLSTVDIDKGTPIYGAGFMDADYAKAGGAINKNVITLYPNPGYVGTIPMWVGVSGTPAYPGQPQTWDDVEVVNITVGDLPIKTKTPRTIRPVVGVSGTFEVARFTDSDPAGKAGDWYASIYWGDGNVSVGTITKNTDGSFSVKGTNTYASEGTYPVTVTIRSNLGLAKEDIGRFGAQTIISSVAAVQDGALTAGPAKTLVGIEDNALTGVTVASFTDADPRGQADDFTVTILWGDGGKSVGIRPTGSAGKYDVLGTHTYQSHGEYEITVIVKDKGGSSTTVKSKAFIGRASLTVNGGPDDYVAEGGTFTNDGTITDTLAGDHSYTAKVDYGDGSGFVNLPIITGANNALTFLLSHKYENSGTYKVMVVVTDALDGSTGTDTITVTVYNVAPEPSVLPQSDTTGVRGQPRTIYFTATDVSPEDVSKGFNYDIIWGDGTPTTYIRDGSKKASHVFAAAGTYKVKVSAIDKDGSSKQASDWTIVITDIALQGGDLVIGGTSAAETIAVTKGDAGKTDVKIGTAPVQSFAVTGRILIYAQDGNDIIAPDPTITRPIQIYGGAGDDIIKGTERDDILVGGAGADKIYGRGGRDILIGGGGKDLLVGGGGDDILIAGGTRHDDNRAAMEAIQAEWLSSRSYALRSAYIRGTAADKGPLNGMNRFNSKTIPVEYDLDTLIGEAGEDLFFGAFSTTSYVKDKLSDLASGEQKVSI